MAPAPSHFSQRPPFTLNENVPGVYRRALASGSDAKMRRISSYAFTYVTGFDRGPEGGEQGGYVVAVGPPEQIVKVGDSYTGRFLEPVLANGRTPTTARHS